VFPGHLAEEMPGGTLLAVEKAERMGVLVGATSLPRPSGARSGSGSPSATTCKVAKMFFSMALAFESAPGALASGDGS